MAGIDPKFYYLTLGLLGVCTLVGLIVAYRLQRDVNVDDAPPTEKELLGPLEQAYYSGLMREEEFHRIQESMSRQKGAEVATASKFAKPRVKPPTVASPGPILGSESEDDTEPEPQHGLGEASPDDQPPPITPTGDSGPDRGPG